MTRLAQFAAAAVLGGALFLNGGFVNSGAVAQSGGYEPAPGYLAPEGYFFEPTLREQLNGYGNAEGDLPEAVMNDRGDGSLTSFAGQRRNYNPGIVGGVLGRVKQSILGTE